MTTGSGNTPPGLDGELGADAVADMLSRQADAEREARAAKKPPKKPAKKPPKKPGKKPPKKPGKKGPKKPANSIDPPDDPPLDPEMIRNACGVLAELPYMLGRTFYELRGLPEGKVGDYIRDLWKIDDEERKILSRAMEVLVARHEDKIVHSLPWYTIGATLAMGGFGRVVMTRRALRDHDQEGDGKDQKDGGKDA